MRKVLQVGAGIIRGFFREIFLSLLPFVFFLLLLAICRSKDPENVIIVCLRGAQNGFFDEKEFPFGRECGEMAMNQKAKDCGNSITLVLVHHLPSKSTGALSLSSGHMET